VSAVRKGATETPDACDCGASFLVASNQANHECSPFDCYSSASGFGGMPAAGGFPPEPGPGATPADTAGWR
jgi:hypothetical protein